MNRKAIISGGTKGIGRAITEALASEGYDVAICSRTESDLEVLKTELNHRFPRIKVLTQVVDMRVKSEVIQFGTSVCDAWKRIDVLVNNAGAFHPGALFDEPDGAMEEMIETNLYSAYHLTRVVVELMLVYRKGHIFNMCSVASAQAYPNGGSYSVSKFALLGFTKNLREELRTQGIKVTAILPGATWTDSWAGYEAPPERLMKPRDVAEAVVSALRMSSGAVVEEIVMRPQLGDIK